MSRFILPPGLLHPQGPPGRPQPLRDPEARRSDRVVVAGSGTHDPSWTHPLAFFLHRSGEAGA